MSLRINGNHRCGASIISENRALSAAHCYRPNSDNMKDFTVLAGSTLRIGDGGSFIIGLDKYIQHPNYNNGTLENGSTTHLHKAHLKIPQLLIIFKFFNHFIG